MIKTLSNLGLQLCKHLYWLLREKYIDKPIYSLTSISMIVDSSPHYFKTVPNRLVKCIVLHATGSSSMAGTIRWFKDPTSKVSSHYVIDKNGKVVQMVDLNNIAWHAGKSIFKGQQNVNGFSVGIELVNSNDGKEPYPREQVNACLTICNALISCYELDRTDIVRHKDIAPGRKSDPNGFDLDAFLASLSFYQEKEKALRH